MRWQASSRVTDPIARERLDAIRIPAETEALRRLIEKMLADLPPADRTHFNFEAWLVTPLTEKGAAPKAFVVDDDLDTLTNWLEGAGIDAHCGRAEADFLGLPLAGHARRRQRFLLEEKERREAERRAAEALGKTDRRNQLEQYAAALGAIHLQRITAPPEKGSEVTLMALAEQSAYGLEQAKERLSLLYEREQERLARDIRLAEARKRARQQALEAANTSENPEDARRYLATVDPLFSSTPLDACVDDASLQAVIVRMNRYLAGYKYAPKRYRR